MWRLACTAASSTASAASLSSHSLLRRHAASAAAAAAAAAASASAKPAPASAGSASAGSASAGSAAAGSTASAASPRRTRASPGSAGPALSVWDAEECAAGLAAASEARGQLVGLQAALQLGAADEAEQLYVQLRRRRAACPPAVLGQLMLLLARKGAPGAAQRLLLQLSAPQPQPSRLPQPQPLAVTPTMLTALIVAADPANTRSATFDEVASLVQNAGADPMVLLREAMSTPELATLIRQHLKETPEVSAAFAAAAEAVQQQRPIDTHSPLYVQWQREAQINVTLALPEKKLHPEEQDSWSMHTTSKFAYDVFMRPLEAEIAKLRQTFDTRWRRQMNGTPGTLVAMRAENLRRRGHYETLLYCGLLSNADIARITLSEMQAHLVGNPLGTRLQSLALNIGQSIYRGLFVAFNKNRGLHQVLNEIYPKYLEFYNDPEQWRRESPAAYWKKLLAEHNVADLTLDNLQPWPAPLLLACGHDLLQLAIKTSQLKEVTNNPDDTDPAFPIIMEFAGHNNNRRVGILRTAPEVDRFVRRIEKKSSKKEVRLERVFDASKLPMVTPPLPWTGVSSGATILSPVTLARTGLGHFNQLTSLAQCQDNLRDMFDALTALSSVPWRINNTMLKVVSALYRTKKAYPEVEIVPEFINKEEFSKRAAYAQAPPEKQEEIFRQAVQENFGQRCDLSYKLALAEWLVGRPFWLPHNVDFRGRSYPLSPYLTHMGSDVSRALLQFHEGKPLGDRGLYWLKVHLANVYGKDKLSFADRVAFVESNMAGIRASVAEPLAGLKSKDSSARWWIRGDKPWQVLAASNELVAALDSGKPEEFVSHFPVHQDGTCNGLQHYAVLGGDVEGARQVNVIPTPGADKPADVYTAVARRMDTAIAKIAKGELDDFPPERREQFKAKQKLAAKIHSKGPLPRKVVKQTVMTTVYGVTFIGGREQIAGQLEDHGLSDGDEADLFQTSSFLTSLVFLSLGQIFERASMIQTWLAKQAGAIASSGAPVSWVTPLGFTVVQPYTNSRNQQVKSRSATVMLDQGTFSPNPRRQRSAFPPNFIHSFDATHMFYTATGCREAGVTFAAVHDSFWTHAATVDILGKVTREQFLRLHSQPLLENLYYSMKLHYDGRPTPSKPVEIKPPPPRGNLDLTEVLKSPFFFS